MIDWMQQDVEEYISRGERIMSVLNGTGTVEVLHGVPDVEAEQSDWDKGERFDPDLDFDINSYSRVDKFDGVEIGHEVIESKLANASHSDGSSEAEEK